MSMLARLRARLALFAALLTGAITAAVAAVAFCLFAVLYTAQQQAAFEADVADLASQWSRTGALELESILALERQKGIQVYLEENGAPLLVSGLQGADAAPLLSTLEHAGFDPELPPLSTQPETTFLDRAAPLGQPVRLAGRKQTTPTGWRLLVAWQPLASQRQTLWRAGAAFCAVALAGMGLIALACWAVAGRAVKPVARAMEEQREFVRAAGHELRTPLGVLRAGLAVLPQEEPQAARRHIALLDAEAMRMSGLIDQLLLLSGGGTAQAGPARRLEPDTLLLDLAEAWEPAVRRAGRRLEAVLPEDPLPAVLACREELCQILAVFLDNALQYAPADSAITVSCRQAGRKVVWTVADQGPGVPDGCKEKVFRRFWRSEESRSDRAHFGLGLSVAAELAGRNGWEIGVADTPGGGASFWVAAGV